MEFEEILKPLLDRMDELERQLAEKDKKIETVCKMNNELLNRKQEIKVNPNNKNNVLDYIKGGR